MNKFGKLNDHLSSKSSCWLYSSFMRWKELELRWNSCRMFKISYATIHLKTTQQNYIPTWVALQFVFMRKASTLLKQLYV